MEKVDQKLLGAIFVNQLCSRPHPLCVAYHARKWPESGIDRVADNPPDLVFCQRPFVLVADEAGSGPWKWNFRLIAAKGS